MSTPLVLPRPGKNFAPQPPIAAPSEEAFTAAFGALLPHAQYVVTPVGRAAYYVFDPVDPGAGPVSASASVSVSGSAKRQPPTRVLLLHGVQTPALGLLPLVTALRTQFPAVEFALVDLWGHGLSEAPVVPLTTGVFAGLVEEVVRVLGWDEGDAGVAVVGYSFGSVVGMEWVSSYCGGEGDEGREEEEVEEEKKKEEEVEEEKEEDGKKKNRHLHSLTLVAPAGLLQKSWFTPEEQTWLSTSCAPSDEAKAADFVVQALEGGPLTVPPDAAVRIARGEVVAQAVKQWQLREHAGHWATVVGVFRDGGVFENQALFGRARATGVPMLAVLGELDELSSVQEVQALGVETRVVGGVGHGVVRERAGEVAAQIGEFWGVDER